METSTQIEPSRGMRTFFTIWFGQLVSLLGSQLTGFALGVWVYDQTHSISMLALVQVALQAPYVLLSPLAGVFADRWNRRTAMIVSDAGAGLSVLVASLLFLTHHLQAWMVIPINLWMSSFQTLMWPSLTAATTLLVPKQHYGRASAFTQLGEALPAIAGPAMAGVLYASIQLGKMALIDFASYAFSVLLLLLFVRIPNPAVTIQEAKGERSLWKEMRFGWDYIMARRGLLTLLFFFMSINFLSGVIGPLITPLILDNWNASTLGYISTLMGVGMLAGTLVMSAWGGTRRKIYTLLASGLLSGLFLLGAGFRASLPLLAVCGFGVMFTGPFMNASSQAIWQAKVAPDLQGRVFAIRRAIAWSASIISPLLAAPLADYLFKPAMSAGGALSFLLGPIFGVGSSRGVGVMISLVGLLTIVASLVGANVTRLRRVELDLPDHDVVAQAAAVAPADE
ncbi:MAG TPA: MFS transporter [Anaerolineales bacterium]|nr:MFS transporter [Anaerolineales bacterium]